MNGIYLINDRITLNGLIKEDSIMFQEQSIKNYMKEQNIHPVKLNPYQLKDYYTIPHALLYDLKKAQSQLDCFIYYSPMTLDDFIFSYPAKWLILKSYFKEIITIDQENSHTIQRVI
ncbi:hypothetical protein HPT25_18155 [Bacillus sp. BRMEA1]|uniref:hypothetical protein n=1 Tax=Neobacillus endophyticus TaxID=2738405 RepID=UPI0015674809|nr:hypothetical protein [Neobacillus endophyticus]NRD79286.1 hypothetical protein [Neobacillus endophyticus]